MAKVPYTREQLLDMPPAERARAEAELRRMAAKQIAIGIVCLIVIGLALWSMFG